MKNGSNRKKKPRIHLSTKKIILLICALCVICAFMVTATVLSQRGSMEDLSSTSAEVKKEPDEKSDDSEKTHEDAKKSVNTTKPVEPLKSVEKLENKATKNTDEKSENQSTAKPTEKSENKTSTKTNEVSKTNESSKADEVPKTIDTVKVPNEVKTVDEPKIVGKKGTLIFVFDDGGQNLTQLEPFLKLPFPVTVAVMPGLPHSAEAAERVRKSGKELILHQPMQAQNLAVNPGPGAILPDMHGDAIKTLVAMNLAEVGPVAGLNNHEGSLITESLDDIGTVLDVCKQYGIYFLDSRTTAASKAPDAAQIRNMKIWERNVFLDNTQNKKDILAEVDKGLGIADKNGHAIMIGHVWSNDLANILTELYPELIKQGYSFATISQMINGEI